MSDYTDYENNLVFAPTSADDLNKQGRKSDVLVAALEKCEKLEKQLDTAVSCLELIEIKSDKFNNTCGFIEQLDDIKATCQEALYHIKGIKQ